MIHIVSVHHGDLRWLPVQLRYIQKNFPPNFRLYLCVPDENNIPEDVHRQIFFVSDNIPKHSNGSVDHATKLNFLAKKVQDFGASEDDIIVFLDSDAFPVKPCSVGWFRSILSADRFAAIQRYENNQEVYPHPAFCFTTVGFWQQIKGDWLPGETRNANGEIVCDTGGRLVALLGQHPWKKFLRTNHHHYHPLWFGVYDRCIYHHGAGSRFFRFCRADRLPREKQKKIRTFRVWLHFIRQYFINQYIFSKIKRDEHFFRRW